jgi:hypothetical protein
MNQVWVTDWCSERGSSSSAWPPRAGHPERVVAPGSTRA